MKFYRFLLVLASFLLLTGCQPITSNELSVLWPAPTFALTNQNGERVTNKSLDGKVWLVNFIFTTCPDVCPTELTPKMKAVQEIIQKDASLNQRVQLISLSVDPKNDTPAVLSEYADRFDADTKLWWFLVGSEQETVDLMQNGFKVGIAERHVETTPGAHAMINHSTRFALVDKKGQVRKVPLSSDITAEQLANDIQKLANE